jgi:hypothetical protein
MLSKSLALIYDHQAQGSVVVMINLYTQKNHPLNGPRLRLIINCLYGLLPIIKIFRVISLKKADITQKMSTFENV